MKQLGLWIYRDIKGYLRSSFSISLLVIVNFVCGYALLTTLYYLKNSLALFFWLNTVCLMLLIICPILVMRLFSESKSLKELWRTMPVPTVTIILGKYIGMCSLLAGIVTSLLPVVIVIGWWTQSQWGSLISGILGVLILGWTIIGIGTVIGILVDSQRAVGLWTFTVGVFFWLIEGIATLFSEPLRTILTSTSLAAPALALISGKISSVQLGFSLGIIGLSVWIGIQCWSYRYNGAHKRAIMRIVIGCLIMVVWMSGLNQFPGVYDIKRRNQPLSNQTKLIVSRIQFPIEITVWHDNNADSEAIFSVLNQYSKLNSQITIQYRLRSSDMPEPIVLIEGHSKRIQFPLSRLTIVLPENGQQLFMGESILSGALQSLFKPIKTIGWVTGHGELDLKNTSESGTSSLAQAMVNEPYELEEINVQNPKNADVIVLAGSINPLSKNEIEVLFNRNKVVPMLILTHPSGYGVDAFLLKYGIRQSHSPIQNSIKESSIDQFDCIPIIKRHPITQPLQKKHPVILPNTEALIISSNETVIPLLISSEEAWIKMRDRDLQGPFCIGVYVPETEAHKSIIIIASRDWIQNSNIYTQSNRELILNCLAYLVKNEAGIRPEITELHQVYLTKNQWGILLLLVMGFPLMSTVFWWLRIRK